MSGELKDKKDLFDHIVNSMRENKLHMVKFDGIEVQKLIHEGELKLGAQMEMERAVRDEDLYWSVEGS